MPKKPTISEVFDAFVKEIEFKVGEKIIKFKLKPLKLADYMEYMDIIEEKGTEEATCFLISKGVAEPKLTPEEVKELPAVIALKLFEELNNENFLTE